MMKVRILVMLAAVMLVASSGLAVNVVNPGFEVPAVSTNTWNWNDREGTGVDVITGWSHDVVEDTGTWNGIASEGLRSAFVIGGGASGPYQDLGYSIVAGESYIFSMDVVNAYGYTGTGTLTFNAHDVAGRVGVASLAFDFSTLTTGVWTSQSLSFTALAGEDYIGNSLGIEFNTLEDGAYTWHGYDNAQVVPEPATMALLVLGGLSLIRRRK